MYYQLYQSALFYYRPEVLMVDGLSFHSTKPTFYLLP